MSTHGSSLEALGPDQPCVDHRWHLFAFAPTSANVMPRPTGRTVITKRAAWLREREILHGHVPGIRLLTHSEEQEPMPPNVLP